MQRVQLESRTLASALYHPDRRQLELEFRTGKRYLYFGVPPMTYHALLLALSKGAFFNANIRNRFPFQNLSLTSAPIVLVPPLTK